MKYEIYGEKRECEKTIELKLVKEDNDVVLIAVDETGKRMFAGSILKITDDGTLILCSNISDKIGLQLDSNGTIKISVE